LNIPHGPVRYIFTSTNSPANLLDRIQPYTLVFGLCINLTKGIKLLATLTKTSKRRGYLDGRAGARTVFQLFEDSGVRISAVRRYQNTERAGSFQTVEVKKNTLLEILEDKLEIREENNRLKEQLELAQNRICYLEQYTV